MALIKNNIEKKQKESVVYNQLLGYGWTPAQASGIAGNLVHESGLNTTIIGDKNLKDKAYGIAQFRGPRFENLKKMYPNNEWTKLENQVAYVNWELNNTESKAGKLLKTVNTPMAAGQVVSDLYERPQVKYYKDTNRQKAVENFYKTYVNNNYSYTPEGNQIENVVIPKYDFNYYGVQEQSPPELTQNILPTQQVSNLPIQEENINLAQENVNYEVEAAKQILLQKQQQKINEQKFIQDLLVASQVKYVEPVEQQEIYQKGGIIKDDRGQWTHPGEITEINSPSITMRQVPFPVLGVSKETGEQKMMFPEQNYYFENTKSVIEYPQIKRKNKRFL